ncbi:PAS domain-containing protein, partial [Streptomyces sp. NPDC000348]|uniref:PAS domain-containing protein n=1 Tax=Streptomyces sp. NPDC000348 TaxID=3364538 RepID=UPI0036778987
MDRGTERDAPPDRRAGAGAATGRGAGRIPLAVVVVDRDGLVSHWSRGARRLFSLAKEDALGRPAVDLLPVTGALPEEPEGEDPEDEACAPHGGGAPPRPPGPRPPRGRARGGGGPPPGPGGRGGGRGG